MKVQQYKQTKLKIYERKKKLGKLQNKNKKNKKNKKMMTVIAGKIEVIIINQKP